MAAAAAAAGDSGSSLGADAGGLGSLAANAGVSGSSLVAAAAAAAAGDSDSSLRVDLATTGESSLPKWVMLDRYVFNKYDLGSFREDEATSREYEGISPEGRNSNGDPFRVSFCFSAPPGISRFYLHLPEGTNPEENGECSIIASYRNAILFCLYWALPTDISAGVELRFCHFKQDLFIYTAGDIPSLTLLPNCPEPLEDGDEMEDAVGEEMDANALHRIIQFPDDDCVGILRNDSEDFVVAALYVVRSCYTSSSGREYTVPEAHMCIYSSSKSKWELHGLPICCEQKHQDELFRWSTNRVVAFGTYLCWIDYQRGILFCEVFKECLQVSYVRLPVDVLCHVAVYMGMYRSICIVKDEGRCKMKLVDARHCDGYVPVPRSDGFEVTFWTLIMEDGKMNWKYDLSITNSELRLSNFISSPHGPLTFPFLSMDDPHVAYFVVAELGCHLRKVWLVPVDLISRSVKCALPYLNGEEDLLGDDADMTREKRFNFDSFLPSEITQFFQQITGDRDTSMNSPVALPSCVQGEQPVGSSKTSVKKENSMLPQASSDVPDVNVGSLHSGASTEHAQNIVSQIDCPQSVTGDDQTKGLREISFRLLCPDNLVGDLIGKNGLIIKGIEDGTGVRIDIGACLSGCVERVITISALESPEQCSRVQGALLHIFDRMAGVECSLFGMPSQSLARALVVESQVGLDGAIIKEIMDVTRARIQILDDTDVPPFASRYERVLQITGEVLHVRDALCLVSWKLRNNIFSSKKTNYNKSGYAPSSDFTETDATRQAEASLAGPVATYSSVRVDQGCSISYKMDPVENHFRAILLCSSEVQELDNENGVGIKNSNNGIQKPAYRNDIGINNPNTGVTFPTESNLVRKIKDARTRVTYETAVPSTILYHVYDKLAHLKEVSGADVTICHKPSETNEAMLVVSGLPDQSGKAQELLLDWVLKGE